MSQRRTRKLIIRGKVLVLARDSKTREEVSDTLTEKGIEVLTTDSLSELDDLLKNFDPQIVLVVTDDPVLLDKLIHRASTACSVRQPSILVCHPFSQDYTRSQAFAAGAKELLTWPLDREELLHRTDMVLKERRTQRENRENASQLADALATVQRHNLAYSEELEEAKILQEVFFPRQKLIANKFALNFRITPTQKLCGDFIDINRLDTFRIAISLIDVSGHGAAAAMVTGMVHAWLHANLHSHVSLAAKAEELNQYLHAYTPESMYATGFIAILDTLAGSIEYILAGHPEPLAWKNKENKVIPLPIADTPAIGLTSSFKASVRRYEIDEGDALLIYSDGLLDSFANEDDPLARLGDIYARHNRSLSCLRNRKCQLIDDILQEGRRPEDDMAMLCLTRYAETMQAGNLQITLPAIGHYQFSMPSTEDALRDLQEFLAYNIREEMDDDIFWDMMQVASELTRNAAEWGNGYQAERRVECTVTLDQEEVRLVVRDEGEGFDPQKEAAPCRNQENQAGTIRPGGFGLKICRELCDELLIEQEGRQVEAVFRLSSRKES